MDTKQKLLSIALELIWQSHYSNVGVNEICRQAGVTKGAFYHHFESKASLFCDATNHYWELIKPDLDSVCSPTHNALEQLENLIRFLLISILDVNGPSIKGCPFFSVGTQLGTDDEKVIEALSMLSEKAISYNHAIISGLNSQGYLHSVKDESQLARLMYHLIHGIISATNITENISVIKQDLPEGLYRLLGLKTEYWFSCTAPWQKTPTLTI